MFKTIGTSLFVLFALLALSAQQNESDFKHLKLNDLSNFENQDGNWKIVESVTMSRLIDVHKNGNASVKTQSGSGVLINLNDDVKRSALVTNFDHGDLDIEFEFMLPKGSNSGFYLQGRYEIQLFDSWGVKRPKYSDLGGIYRNWESEEGKVYMGKAPNANPAKAPGLWQKMFVSFNSPKFDEDGNKVKNARLNLVKINGVVVHENIEIPLPTGGPIENNEVARGPIMIQGDHGAVAIRNIKYKNFDEQKVSTHDWSYKYWEGSYENEGEYQDKPPLKVGKSNALQWEMVDVKDYFGLQLDGKIEIPKDGTYKFTLINNGGVALYIDGKKAVSHYKKWDYDNPGVGSVFIPKGSHDITVYYQRADAWIEPGLGVFVESNTMRQVKLHHSASLPQREVSSPIYAHVGGKPKILRAFLDFNGDGGLRRTHTVAVGSPDGIHYVYDNGLGVLSCVWKGKFLDVTPMWHSRGDGSYRPMGDVVYLDNSPQIGMLKSGIFEGDQSFVSKGYSIDPNSQNPIFNYTINDTKVSDFIDLEEDKNTLTRRLSFEKEPSGSVFRLASGSKINQIDENNYIINGTYYIKLGDHIKCRIVANDSTFDLLTDITSSDITYSLIW